MLFKPLMFIFELLHEKPCLMAYVNNIGTNQPAYPHSLISTFVVHCLDSMVPVLIKSRFSRLASLCGWAGRFESYLVATDRRQVFSRHGSFYVCAYVCVHACLVFASLWTTTSTFQSHLSSIMRNLSYAICKQQRRRSGILHELLHLDRIKRKCVFEHFRQGMTQTGLLSYN